MATGSVREARRRRILEGGSDRLALITGRTPTQSSTSQDLDFAGFSPPSILENHHDDLNTSVHQNEEYKPSNQTVAPSDPAAGFNQFGTSCSGSGEGLFMGKAEMSHGSAKSHRSEVHARPDQTRTVHERTNPSPLVHLRSLLNIRLGDLFTYQQVTSAVSATEQSRTFCSLTIAFLVVLYYMGFPIVSSRLMGTIILFRPLYVVLLASIILILQHLLGEEQNCAGRTGKEAGKSKAANGGYGWADEAGKAIEMAFMAQNVIGALFMDCTVYAIIVICGLSVA